MSAASGAVAPYRIHVPDEVLADLRERLARTRWPDEVADADWSLGTELGYLRRFVAYWQEGYDWREHEAALNTLAHFRVHLDGIDLHFVHERGEGANPRPLLLLHGWPSSIVEYHKLIPRLTRPSQFGGDPDDSFTVVVPSLPGYGLSFAPGQPRFGIAEMADTLARLMRDVLGYDRFAAHGHDWGAFICTRLGYARPHDVRGIHVTLLAVARELPATLAATPEERRFHEQLRHWLAEETGYSTMMATKPQTLAYALTDSPVGLAAWIVEKYRSWSDCDGDVDACFGRDVLITNVMLYWATGAINATFWPYYARAHGPWVVPAGAKVVVPTAYAEYPREILSPPRSLAEQVYGDIRRWTRMPRGGHFPALETPDELAHDLRAFFGSLS